MDEIAIIFDMDGVLVDTNPFHKVALEKFCKKYGYNLTEEQLREKIYGRTNKDWISNLFDEPLTDQQLREYGEEKEAMFRDIYEGHVVPVNGLIEFLEVLENHSIPKAIATSAPRSNVDFILARIKAQGYFETILDDTFVSRGKPDPEIYLKTIKALNKSPEECIVFEDSLSGVEAAKGAGAKVIGITTTHTKEELHQCDLIIPDFVSLEINQLIKLIRS